MRDAGAAALAALAQGPALHTLSLNLSNNFVGAGGAEALAALKAARALRALSLNLSHVGCRPMEADIVVPADDLSCDADIVPP